MRGRNIKEKEGSAIVRYIRNSYIPPNWKDMRCIADITKLSAIPNPAFLIYHLININYLYE
jgi:hypothetical protein